MKEQKGHHISKKGTSEFQKGKRTARYTCPNMVFELFRPNKFLKIYKRGCFKILDTKSVQRRACTTLYSKCDQAYDLWQKLGLAFEVESDL